MENSSELTELYNVNKSLDLISSKNTSTLVLVYFSLPLFSKCMCDKWTSGFENGCGYG